MGRDKHFRIPSQPSSSTRKRPLLEDRESRREGREESPGRRNEAGRTKSEEKDWRDAQAVREAMLLWYSCAKTIVSTSMIHGNVQELQEGEKIITACMHYHMSLQQWATTLEFVPQHILRHESVESTIDLLRQVRARFSNTYLNFLAVIQRKASRSDPSRRSMESTSPSASRRARRNSSPRPGSPLRVGPWRRCLPRSPPYYGPRRWGEIPLLRNPVVYIS